jgi:hypothetical protein
MSAGFHTRREGEADRTGHRRGQWFLALIGACSILIASSCAGAATRSALGGPPPTAQTRSSTVAPQSGDLGSCTAAYGPGGAGLRISIESPVAGDLVVDVTAPWTVLREDDPTFAGATTVEFPTTPGAQVSVTLTVAGVTLPCAVSELAGSPPVFTAKWTGAPRLLFVGDSLTAQAATALTDTLSRTGAVTMVAGHVRQRPALGV